ncbi:MAG TPA: PilZ domain-containing protein, partial [Steroidobacteraceae bacterium]
SSGLPPAARVRMTSSALEWFGEIAPAVGETGLLSVYINPALPQPVKIPCVVAGHRTLDGILVTQMRFKGLSDAVVEMLDKLIFRHHRRLVAGAKLATN